jgi:magnesium transporter
MLRTIARGGAVAECEDPAALWYDLESPSDEEEAEVETCLGIDVPTPAERAAFEESARLYEENDTLHLTATLLGRRDEGPLVSGPVTFILAKGKLVTVRQVRPRALILGTAAHRRGSVRRRPART